MVRALGCFISSLCNHNFKLRSKIKDEYLLIAKKNNNTKHYLTYNSTTNIQTYTPSLFLFPIFLYTSPCASHSGRCKRQLCLSPCGRAVVLYASGSCCRGGEKLRLCPLFLLHFCYEEAKKNCKELNMICITFIAHAFFFFADITDAFLHLSLLFLPPPLLPTTYMNASLFSEPFTYRCLDPYSSPLWYGKRSQRRGAEDQHFDCHCTAVYRPAFTPPADRPIQAALCEWPPCFTSSPPCLLDLCRPPAVALHP